MELDLETFLTTLYVIVDDLYRQHIRTQVPPHGGPAPKLADSEVLTLALAAQWRRGTPWSSQRSCLRSCRKHLRTLFPGLTSQSAFNRRVRRLWGAFILLQLAVAAQLVTAGECEIMDGVPVRLAHGARSFHPRRLAEIARIGKGGTDRYFYGLHLLVAISSGGIATGWTLAAANVQERWLAELLLSSRAGSPQLTGPREPRMGTPRLAPPSDWVGPVQGAGQRSGKPGVADLGFDGTDWLTHWAGEYGATVVTPPRGVAAAAIRWLRSLRHVVETCFAHLCESFGLQYPGAHTRWGLLAQVAAKLAAYNLGILINRRLGRPDFAFATLIV
jgi:hypothetical protein